jgi:hypothetical protein
MRAESQQMRCALLYTEASSDLPGRGRPDAANGVCPCRGEKTATERSGQRLPEDREVTACHLQ